jgi:hypothetical protein
MKLKIKEGTTSKIIRLFIQDSSATDGSGKTAIGPFSGAQCYWIAEGDTSPTQLTISVSGTVGTYSSGGLTEVDITNMPGVYELGIPDACIDATSDGSVLIMFRCTADTVVPVLIEIELDKIDYRSSSYAKLEASASTIVQGNPVAGTLSFTEMTTDLTETTDDHYNGRVLIFTSGVLAGQATDITDYDGASKKLTFTALSDQPATGGQLTSFVIV